MQIDKISSGNLPDEINVVIEIPMNDSPVKYEFDKESGAIFVDRFIQVAMFYPAITALFHIPYQVIATLLMFLFYQITL